MATLLRKVLVTNLLLLIVVMVDVKSVLTEQGEQSNRMKKILEQSMIELKEMMKKQKDRIKVLEDCNACSKIKEVKETLNELQEGINSMPDRDACCSNSGRCDVNAVCNNTDGSYTCTCKAGFSENGKSCIAESLHDIDECASGVHDCHSSDSCINSPGSFHCLCNYPYIGDGKTCRHSAEECQNYQNLTGADRNVNHSRVGWSVCDSKLGPGWFRFTGATGTKMVISCPPTDRCQASVTGWLTGGHPTVHDGRVTKRVCFHWRLGCCTWSTYIQVRNCGSFYVYYFDGTPTCNLRYCGTD